MQTAVVGEEILGGPLVRPAGRVNPLHVHAFWVGFRIKGSVAPRTPVGGEGGPKIRCEVVCIILQ